MGLGPSTKMTTLHHYHCPVTREFLGDAELSFQSLIVNGVSERYDDKIFTAVRTGELGEGLHADGAIVITDGWGNHHIDFVTVIEELGKRGIPSVGMSYIARQGRLVCTNDYMDMIVDFNKNESGYESSIVGDNNLVEYDAHKAVSLLKLKLKREGISIRKNADGKDKVLRMGRHIHHVETVRFGEKTELNGPQLTVRRTIGEIKEAEKEYIADFSVHLIGPADRHRYVHTNLDFMPVACKTEDTLGNGKTVLLGGIAAMITGGEANGAYEPHNIGSSEGFLDEVVRFGSSGTPEVTDKLLHVEVTFMPEKGSTVEAVRAAHHLADRVVNEVRLAMKKAYSDYSGPYDIMEYHVSPRKANIIVVKIVSALGNMYESAVFPYEPGGISGAKYLMDMESPPIHISPLQCLDGVIHSLL